LGKYTLIDKEIMRGEMQAINEELFAGERLQDTIARYAYFDVAEMTNRGYNMSILEHDNGIFYVLPFKDKDIEINRQSGELRVLEKDPLGRPVNMALPYSYSAISSVSEGMPKELQELLTLVPPSHQREFLFELVAPLALTGMRRIYINFSRVGSTGKSTVLRKINELYEDMVAWVETNALGERFEKSAFIGKSAVLLDEFDGGGLRAKREFKTLASGNFLRVEIKNGPILNIKNKLTVIVNTNVLRFTEVDDALLDRFIIIPFIRNFNGTTVPPEWDEKTKEKIVSWLVRNVLPRYFKEEPRKYPLRKVKDWID